MYRRITTIAGHTIITRIADSSRTKTAKGRRPKKNPTSEAVAKINKINQARELTAKLNATFRPGDWWLTLSNEIGVTLEESMTKIKKLKRNLQRYCKKHDIPFRMVETVGIGAMKGKVHHHIVMNKEIPLDVLTRYWPEEYVFAQPLKGWNYQRVAKYMLKNAEESKNQRGKFVKAFRCSRQVKKPECRVEQLKREMTFDIEDIQARKGYTIDRDSVKAYEHPIMGTACLEYIEVSTDPEPRVRHYYKGRPIKWESLYEGGEEEQISIMELLESAGGYADTPVLRYGV